MTKKSSKPARKNNQKLLNIEDIELEQIYDFILNGDPDDAPSDIVEYLELMEKIRGMDLRIDKYGSKDAIVNHLIKVNGMSRYLANKAYSQTIEYFYADRDISKTAWLNKLAQKMEKNANIAQLLVKDVNDAYKVQQMYKELKQAIIDSFPDETDIPEGAYDKPNKFYTLTMEDLGKKPQNRKELKEFIQTLPEIPEKVKELAMREAGILTPEIFPDEDPRKD